MIPSSTSAYYYKSTLHAFITISQKEGFRGFYKGLAPSLLGVSHVGIQFPLYEKIKRLWDGEFSIASPFLFVLFFFGKSVFNNILSGLMIVKKKQVISINKFTWFFFKKTFYILKSLVHLCPCNN